MEKLKLVHAIESRPRLHRLLASWVVGFVGSIVVMLVILGIVLTVILSRSKI